MNPTLTRPGPGWPRAGSSCGRPSPTPQDLWNYVFPTVILLVVHVLHARRARCRAPTSRSARARCPACSA